MIEKSKLRALDEIVDKVVFAQEKERFLKAHNAPVSEIIANHSEMTHWQSELVMNSTKKDLQILLKKYAVQFMKHPYLNSTSQQKMQVLNLDAQNILEVLYQISSDQPTNQMLLKTCAYGQVGSFLFPESKDKQFFNQSSTIDLTQDLPYILTDFANQKPSLTLRNRAGCDLYHRCIPFLWKGVASLSFSQSANQVKQFLSVKDPTGAPLSSLLGCAQITSLLEGRTLNEKKEILSGGHPQNESITLGTAFKNILNQPLQTLIGPEGVSFVKDCFAQKDKIQVPFKSFVKNPLQTAEHAHQFLKQIWQQSQKR